MDFNNLAAFERLTGLGFFKITGASSYIPFGNITMVKLATSPAEADAILYKRGGGTLARLDVHTVKPVFSMTTNQFAGNMLPLILMGDRTTDASQSSASGSTTTFTAAKGQAFDIGKRGVTIATVAVSAANKTLGTDYFVDDPNIPQSLISLNGIIILPTVPAGIADGASVVVTYDVPAITREQYYAFTKLNRTGTFRLFLEDSTGSDAREIWDFSCQLSVKSVGDFDPTKFRECVLDCAIFGNPTVTTRPA